MDWTNCDCGDFEGPPEPHGCPFQMDVWNDAEFTCTCCPHAERECLYDI